MLQASPRDRRAIFEEAAGISRFKAKKVEAQRRLERVEQNLLRLSDIVEELDDDCAVCVRRPAKRDAIRNTPKGCNTAIASWIIRLPPLATQFDTASERLADGRRHLASVAPKPKRSKPDD